MKPLLFKDLARRRLEAVPPGPPPADLEQAKVDFLEALVSRNYRAARASCAVIARHARPEPPPSVAERARRERRQGAAVAWVGALRELREEEARGIVRPLPQPEQVAEAGAATERLRRWLAGDGSADHEARMEGPRP